jgi:hypothetical protein
MISYGDKRRSRSAVKAGENPAPCAPALRKGGTMIFTIFVGACALLAGIAIGWCMAKHIGGREGTAKDKSRE